MYYNIEFKGTYKNYPYMIIFNTYYGYRCGYVGLPETHKYYKMHYSCLPDILPENSLTFSDFMTHITNDDLWWIGYDCNHLLDGPDIEKLTELCGEDYVKTLIDKGHIYTTNKCTGTLEQCKQWCKLIIDRIK